ncbi:Sjogren's syndrome/scleroderma autoantigen 1 family protein [Haloarchaeobius sp. TZWSO28]|uniref:Sjogren's syndrome/scleroderma autoantigen 1 family protein n=1 Tax=Haloarchaeobius sp. TZWSO28 TaxID=3446119 RepID=UPI003EBC263A
MSEFDKEAEREKLRKKFAKEEEDRKTTQRMSELLLQGATMTNQHCDTCGDPIFRHKGQQFCPSCQAAGQEAQRQQQAQQQQQAQEAQNPAQDQQADTPDQPTPSQSVADVEAQGVSQSQSGDDFSSQVQGHTPARRPDRQASAPALAGEFGDAEASIAETIRYFSDAAANTDDPARARECLAAVKEAAQALSALRR